MLKKVNVVGEDKTMTSLELLQVPQTSAASPVKEPTCTRKEPY
jgi:hypothetical protein